MARRPGVTQVFSQTIWKSGDRAPGTGPLGRALHTAATLGWSPREGWWCRGIPGQEGLLQLSGGSPQPRTAGRTIRLVPQPSD